MSKMLILVLLISLFGLAHADYWYFQDTANTTTADADWQSYTDYDDAYDQDWATYAQVGCGAFGAVPYGVLTQNWSPPANWVGYGGVGNDTIYWQIKWDNVGDGGLSYENRTIDGDNGGNNCFVGGDLVTGYYSVDDGDQGQVAAFCNLYGEWKSPSWVNMIASCQDTTVNLYETGIWWLISGDPPSSGWVSTVLNSPTNTTYTDTNVSLNATCSGSFDAYLLNFTVNNTVVYSNLPTLNNTAYATSLIMPGGYHNASAVCWNATTSNTTDAIYFGVVSPPPSPPNASITYPTNNSVFCASSAINITWQNATTTNPIATYNLSLLNQDYSFNGSIMAINTTADLFYNWNGTIGGTAIPPGSYVLELNATDTADLNSSSYITFNYTFCADFTSPTPPNSTNNFTYGMIYNFTSTSDMTNCLMEIDGTNYTGSIHNSDKSCNYTLSYAQHLFNNTYDIIGFGNVSGTMYQTNETRTIPYYGCGYVNSNVSLIGNISILGSDCLYINQNNLELDGNGFTISGNSSSETTGINVGYLFSTKGKNVIIRNVKVMDFDKGVYWYKSNNSELLNATIYNNRIGVDIYYSSNISVRDSTIYSGTNGIRHGGLTTIGNFTLRLSYFDNLIIYNQTAGFYLSSRAITTNSFLYNNSIGYNCQGCADSIVSDNIFTNNTIGINMMWVVSNSSLINNTASGNSIGLYISEYLRSGKTIANNTHLYNNQFDLYVNNSHGGSNFTFYNLIFDNPLGTLQNYSNITLIDDGNEAYTINWTQNSSALPNNYFSFANKYINITTVSGTPNIDSITFHWQDSELTGYNETFFHLYKYNGTWTILNNTPDTTNNQISFFGLTSFSDFALLQQNVSAYFIAPTPENDTYVTDNPIALIWEGTANISDPCYFDINGLNYTGTNNGTACNLSFTNLTHGNQYNITGWANFSGDWVQVNETRTITWNNEADCIQFIDAFAINGTAPYIGVGGAYLYVNSTITLNNTCASSIASLQYDINDGVADATWTTYFVDLDPNELKNFTGYLFRVPITFTNNGGIPSESIFAKTTNNLYTLTTTYGRNISNIFMQISVLSDDTSLYKCEADSCPYTPGTWEGTLSYTLSGGQMQRSEDTLNNTVRYVQSYNVISAGGGGSGGGAPSSGATFTEPPTSAPPAPTVEPLPDGTVINLFDNAVCCVPMLILVVLAGIARMRGGKR